MWTRLQGTVRWLSEQEPDEMMLLMMPTSSATMMVCVLKEKQDQDIVLDVLAVFPSTTPVGTRFELLTLDRVTVAQGEVR